MRTIHKIISRIMVIGCMPLPFCSCHRMDAHKMNGAAFGEASNRFPIPNQEENQQQASASNNICKRQMCQMQIEKILERELATWSSKGVMQASGKILMEQIDMSLAELAILLALKDEMISQRGMAARDVGAAIIGIIDSEINEKENLVKHAVNQAQRVWEVRELEDERGEALMRIGRAQHGYSQTLAKAKKLREYKKKIMDNSNNIREVVHIYMDYRSFRQQLSPYETLSNDLRNLMQAGFLNRNTGFLNRNIRNRGNIRNRALWASALLPITKARESARESVNALRESINALQESRNALTPELINALLRKFMEVGNIAGNDLEAKLSNMNILSTALIQEIGAEGKKLQELE